MMTKRDNLKTASGFNGNLKILYQLIRQIYWIGLTQTPHAYSALRGGSRGNEGSRFPPNILEPIWLFQRVTEGSSGLQRVPEGSRGFQRVPADYRGFQRVPAGSRGFKRVPEGSRGSQRVPAGSRGFQRVLEGSRGFQRVPTLLVQIIFRISKFGSKSRRFKGSLWPRGFQPPSGELRVFPETL